MNGETEATNQTSEPRNINISEARNGFVLSSYGSQPGPNNATIAQSLDEVLELVRQHFS